MYFWNIFESGTRFWLKLVSVPCRSHREMQSGIEMLSLCEAEPMAWVLPVRDLLVCRIRGHMKSGWPAPGKGWSRVGTGAAVRAGPRAQSSPSSVTERRPGSSLEPGLLPPVCAGAACALPFGWWYWNVGYGGGELFILNYESTETNRVDTCVAPPRL